MVEWYTCICGASNWGFDGAHLICHRCGKNIWLEKEERAIPSEAFNKKYGCKSKEAEVARDLGYVRLPVDNF